MTGSAAADEAGTASKLPRVLIVDDDQDLADTYELWLSDKCDVETAYNGEAAIDAFDEGFDIVLLDRRMPGIPGDRVLEEIRKVDPDCQVAMLTAVEPDTDIIDLPFDDYLVKPVTQSDLRETIDDLLLRTGFDPEAQEFFALESKSETLADRDESNLRDPAAAADLQEEATAAGESERIAALRNKLERLQRITSVIRDIDEQLVVATSREEIESMVCERLVNSDPYELTWIGEYSVTIEETSPRVGASKGGHRIDTEMVADGGGAVALAVSTGDVQVVEDLSATDGPALLDPVEFETGESTFAAGAVVPLVYRDTVYGVLNVFTNEEGVFDDQEVAVLSELGDSIANAINSVESKKLMLSDTVVELEFDISDGEDVFVGLSETTGSRLELKGFVPAADGELTTYLEVVGTSTDAFLDAAAEADSVVSVRGIGESQGDRLYELRVSGPTAVLTLIDAGAKVNSMQIDEGSGHLTATIAPETDVRTVVESFQEQFDVDLVAKRETERDFQSTENFRQALEDRLTERQYSVLKAAYTAGYFDWPRGSTAEEIAESLDLAPPTLHEHLRAAQKELIGSFFEETENLERD